MLSRNIHIFSTIKNGEKISVKGFEANIDSRYFQTLRRKSDFIYGWDSSREATKNCIIYTYEKIMTEDVQSISIETIIQSLDNLNDVMIYTYPDFKELHAKIADFTCYFRNKQLKIFSQKLHGSGSCSYDRRRPLTPYTDIELNDREGEGERREREGGGICEKFRNLFCECYCMGDDI